jgi:hypothetical protein
MRSEQFVKVLAWFKTCPSLRCSAPQCAHRRSASFAHWSKRGGISGVVQSFGCFGNTLRTRAGDHTNPKRKRGFRLSLIAFPASVRGVYPQLNQAGLRFVAHPFPVRLKGTTFGSAFRFDPSLRKSACPPLDPPFDQPIEVYFRLKKNSSGLRHPSFASSPCSNST